MKKTIVADTHVHFYPCYDIEDTLETTFLNFEKLTEEVEDPDAIAAIFLTERYDCDFFNVLKSGVAEGEFPVCALEEGPEEGVLRCIHYRSGREILVFAGRQIVTKEKIEILALLDPKVTPDGLSAEDTLKEIYLHGGLPCLCWALGKWTFGRGKLVNEILATRRYKPILFGDSSHRFWPIPTPSAFEEAKRLRVPILAGSDPLPIKGEEKMIGTFGIALELEYDKDAPRSSIIAALSQKEIEIRHVGRRSDPTLGMSRFVRNKFSRK